MKSLIFQLFFPNDEKDRLEGRKKASYFLSHKVVYMSMCPTEFGKEKLTNKNCLAL